MIRFDGVTKRYAAAPGQAPEQAPAAVDGLTLDCPAGRITVLVGPSGCGKTTTLRMVNRMVEPSAGTIWLDGRDTGQVDPAQLRRGIGYVIQHAGLFPHRTVLDNVATVPRLLGWDRARSRRRAQEMLELVGLEPALAGRYPSQLSGGQQQRVGVARALAADPPVMLMDEPFSAVDPVVRAQLQEEFLRLQRELGKTILFVTHDIDEAIRLGDQVAVLRVGGRLAQVAPPERLLADPHDDFVADFLGRDRGYRALGFRPAPALPLAVEPTVALGATPEQARAATAATGQRWLLVLDDAGRPVGWVEPARLSTPIDSAALHRGGTLASVDGSLRAALDAALSSPAGRGVLTDDEGRLAGTVRAEQVLEAVTAEQRAPRGGGGTGRGRVPQPEAGAS